MGTWSAEVLGDDVALDVREALLERLANGEDGNQASAGVLRDFESELADVDYGPVIWFALAATQWEYGCLQDDVKARALAAIDDDGTQARWTGPERAKRKKSLATLAKKLHSPQPKAKRPRRKRPVEVPSHKVPGPDGLATATAFQIGGCGQVLVEMNVKGQRGGAGVFAATVSQQDIALEWLDADTLQITYPAAVTPSKRDEQAFYFGRTIKCVYCRR
jgi:hypothetical protein